MVQAQSGLLGSSPRAVSPLQVGNNTISGLNNTTSCHYSVIVELVLELYCETTKRILCYFTAAESKFFYENSLALIRTYAERQVGNDTIFGLNNTSSCHCRWARGA